MAFDDTRIISLTAGATFSSGDLYKAVGMSSTGGAVLYHNAAGATGGAGVIGTLYSFTATTSAAGSEAVSVGVGPVVKAFAAGSTASYGNLMTFATADSHLVAGTTNEPWGIIVGGASGSTGRILSVAKL